MCFTPSKRALTAVALFGALTFGASVPASADSVFGFGWNAGNNTRLLGIPRRHVSRHFESRHFEPRPVAYQPFDGGGNVFAYYSHTQEANFRPSRTVIAGVCASACTMKLGIRNVCVSPDATLLFHQASNNGIRSELGTRLMLSAYPSCIRQWVLRTGALNSSFLTALSGRQAIAMGMPPC